MSKSKGEHTHHWAKALLVAELINNVWELVERLKSLADYLLQLFN